MIPDLTDRRIASTATGLLREFNIGGVLEAADVHVATRLAALTEETDEQVSLAVALVVRAARHGSVCLDLSSVHETGVVSEDPGADDGVLVELAWPEPVAWADRVRASRLAAAGVVRFEGDLLYLDRHWREEKQVNEDLMARMSASAPTVDEELLAGSVERLFGPGWEEQRDACQAAVRQGSTVLTGGPGTGKTASVARLLVLLSEQHERLTGTRPRIAMAAPTGKASNRLEESVRREAAALGVDDQGRLAGLTASTLHRLLGWRADNRTRFRHHRRHPLPFDVVVVDEVSMVSLSHMARLLEAVRPSTRLLLVGDPDQLASVEAGAVLADIVDGFAAWPAGSGSPVRRLSHNHRTEAAGADAARALDALARAVRADDADAVVEVLRSGTDAVRLIDPADEQAVGQIRDEVTEAFLEVTLRAQEWGPGSDPVAMAALLEDHRLLCAHRTGPHGVTGWNRAIERSLAQRSGVVHYDEWYAGRPILITANDRGLNLSNGDLGVVIRNADGKLRALIGEREFATTRISDAETVYAMTVHKSQGSEARAVSVVLPPEDSPLLTRELFYTAVTRAREQVRIIGTEQELRAAINRRVARASGLGPRLAASNPS